jgi:oligoribonuclease NrnB/cAMP/cGMP phosphodiesterase (DHH superfamily)
MKNLIIYHQIKDGVDCPDGIAAAWVADRYMRSRSWVDCEIIGCSYQTEPPDVSAYDRIFILDFSFPRSVINAWVSDGNKVIVIDHHKTAIDMLGDISRFSAGFEFNFDLLESGATLTWKYFHSSSDREMPAFLEYVRDRDLWVHALPMTSEIHEASANMRYEIKKTAKLTGLPSRGLIFAAFDHLAMLSQRQLIQLMGDRGFELLKPKREKIELAFSRHEMEYLPKVPGSSEQPYRVPVVRLLDDGSEDRLASDICSLLYKRLLGYPFVACIASGGAWSLRSDKDGNNFDVSEVAKLYGGGGHKNSAGFRVQKS